MKKEEVVSFLNNIWIIELLDMPMKDIKNISYKWVKMNWLMEICWLKSRTWYEKTHFNKLILVLLWIEKPLEYKDKLENFDKLNKKQKELCKIFFNESKNQNNFKIKWYFTLEDVYYHFLNMWDFDEKKAHILLIPKTRIKKNEATLYY